MTFVGLTMMCFQCFLRCNFELFELVIGVLAVGLDSRVVTLDGYSW